MDKIQGTRYKAQGRFQDIKRGRLLIRGLIKKRKGRRKKPLQKRNTPLGFFLSKETLHPRYVKRIRR
jgi:hypothetical protein